MTNTARLMCIGTLACLWTPGVGQAQSASIETCPPPPAPGTSVAPGTSPTPSSLQPPSGRILACIGSQSVTESLFRHWANVAKRAEGKRRLSTHAVVSEVMGFLISSDWVIGEAQALNVRVSDEEVRRRFDRIRHEQFPKRGEFKAFLKTSGQTVADLLFRVRGNLLSTRIQQRVVAGQHGASAQANALARFVSEFHMKWRGQTYCSPAYAVGDCGHVQAAL